MEFEIEGDFYRAGKLNAFEQLEIVRKLAPVVGGLAEADLGEVSAGNTASLNQALRALSDLPEVDLQKVIKTCLKKVTKRISTNPELWGNLTTGSGDLMYDDIGLSQMIMFCYYVIKANLANFTKGLPSNSISALADIYSKVRETQTDTVPEE